MASSSQAKLPSDNSSSTGTGEMDDQAWESELRSSGIGLCEIEILDVTSDDSAVRRDTEKHISSTVKGISAAKKEGFAVPTAGGGSHDDKLKQGSGGSVTDVSAGHSVSEGGLPIFFPDSGLAAREGSSGGVRLDASLPETTGAGPPPSPNARRGAIQTRGRTELSVIDPTLPTSLGRWSPPAVTGLTRNSDSRRTPAESEEWESDALAAEATETYLGHALSARVVDDSSDGDRNGGGNGSGNTHAGTALFARRRQSRRSLLLQYAREAPLVEGRVIDGGEGDGAPPVVSEGREEVGRHKHGRHVAFYMLVAVVVIGAIVAAVFSASAAWRRGRESVNPAEAGGLPSPLALTMVPSQMPSASTQPSGLPSLRPTASPTSDRFLSLKHIVSTISSSSDLSNSSSPQFQALEWLADIDPRQVSEDDPEAIIQRYAISAFYFATGGEYWVNNNLFLSDRHECEWHGMHCNQTSDVFGIDFRKNNLTGRIIDEIFALKLIDFNFFDNPMSGTLPPAVCALANTLEELDIVKSGLTGTIPTCIGELQQLRWLFLRGNALTGPLPPSINRLARLTELELSVNALTGPISTIDFGRLRQLREVRLWKNMLTGSLPSSIRHFAGTTLILGENRITGSIPSDIAEGPSSQLQVLALWDTDLTGTIPPAIFKMRQLVGLALGDNFLTGSLPEDAGNLFTASLRGIGLEGNALSGSLPASLGGSRALEAINLHSNLFRGTLPPSIGELLSLRFFEVGNNKLSGTVPETFSNLKSLDWFSIPRNNINGSLDFLCNSSISLVFADCRGQDGIHPEINCGCCNVCCNDEITSGCNHFISSALLIEGCVEEDHQYNYGSVCDNTY